MKFKAQFFSSLFAKFIVNTCLLTISATSISTWAAQEAKPERWFEIEVILFKQLGDKSNLKEQFLDDVSANSLPQYKYSVDLLNAYLQPDLTAIKQFIPLCSNSEGQSRFSLAQKKLTLPLPEQKHLLVQASAFTYQPIIIEQATRLKNTEQVIDWQTKSLNGPLFSPNQLCVYSQTDFQQILDEQQLANFSLDGFAVTALPKKLNASGAHIKSSPYLIADNNLLLKDISKRLRWSKEFQPLLHFGWRQIGVTRKKAIPLKLFAGHHVENDYQQALNDYLSELKAARQQEQLRFEQRQASDAVFASNSAVSNALPSRLSSPLPSSLPSDESEQAEANYYAQIKQQALTQLFNNIDTLNSDDTESSFIDETIQQLGQQSLDDLLTNDEVISDTNEQPLNIGNPPLKPLQPWFLNGFFKLHLDHYLYITADFSLLSSNKLSNTEQSKSVIEAEQTEMKLINFSQNRRVISGEIHYFDHPYIGMIVQIRRFDPTKPADEAVSQAIK